MNKILEKAVAFVLMTLLCLGSIAGYAANEATSNNSGEHAAKVAETESYAAVYENAAEELAELGLMTGDENGELLADEEITRAEFSALVCRMLAAKDLESTTLPFSDVSEGHWAYRDIHTLYELGIVNGYENGMFQPEASVTFAEVATILVKAIGYAEQAQKTAAYPWGQLLTAAQTGLVKQVDGYAEEAATRGMVAKMMINALYIPIGGEEKNGFFADRLEREIYYLSEEGSDDNDGSFSKPWATLQKAAQKLTAGQMLIVEDGTYYETETASFCNAGRQDAPIIVRARNRQQAKLIYPAEIASKIEIAQGADYVSLKNLSISVSEASEEENSQTEDVGITVKGNHCAIVGNDIFGIRSVAIRAVDADCVLIADNTVQESEEGICVFSGTEPTIRGNEIVDAERNGISLLGGVRDAMVYNNQIRAEVQTLGAAIKLGGASDGASAYDSNANTGFAVYNSAVWNNILVSKSAGQLLAGVEFSGAKDCSIFNNNIIKTYTGIIFSQPDGIANGWGWNPENVNPTIKNNIFSGCVTDAFDIQARPKGMVSDYNLFYGTYPEQKENNSKYTNPYFADERQDYKVMIGSAAICGGTEISPLFSGYDGRTLMLHLDDPDGNKREKEWNIGVYNTNSELIAPDVDSSSSAILLDERFEDASMKDWTTVGGVWRSIDGLAKQTNESANRSTVAYNNGLDWTNYEVSADVLSPKAEDGKTNGILFRGDDKLENMYAFRLYANNVIEFASWTANSFSSIRRWDYNFAPNTFYNLKVRAQGDRFTFYVNNKLIGEINNDAHASGTVGLYTFTQTGEFDNLKVKNLN